MDIVFKALADKSRRLLLDNLHALNGQSLGQLCQSLDMTRQAVTKHLLILEEANLVTSIKEGREKLHYINPIPIQEIADRWIHKFESHRVDALVDLKNQLERKKSDEKEATAEKTKEVSETNNSKFVYVVYIRTTPEKLWDALIKPEFTKQYWAETWQECTWEKGATWKLIRHDGVVADAGKVEEIEKPKRLVVSWRNEFRPELTEEGYSRCTFDLEPIYDCVKLKVTHEIDVPKSKLIDAVSNGWPAILASLKSLLETGDALEMTRQWAKCAPSEKKL